MCVAWLGVKCAMLTMRRTFMRKCALRPMLSEVKRFYRRPQKFGSSVVFTRNNNSSHHKRMIHTYWLLAFFECLLSFYHFFERSTHTHMIYHLRAQSNRQMWPNQMKHQLVQWPNKWKMVAKDEDTQKIMRKL